MRALRGARSLIRGWVCHQSVDEGAVCYWRTRHEGEALWRMRAKKKDGMDLHNRLLQRMRTIKEIDPFVAYMAHCLLMTEGMERDRLHVVVCWWMAIKYQALDLAYFDTSQLRSLIGPYSLTRESQILSDRLLVNTEGEILHAIDFRFPSLHNLKELHTHLGWICVDEWLFAVVHTHFIDAFPYLLLANSIREAMEGVRVQCIVQCLIFFSASRLNVWKQLRLEWGGQSPPTKRFRRVTVLGMF